MYLHLGSDLIIRKSDIIGIFELDGKRTDSLTAEYLRRAEKSGRIVSASFDLPKSFIVTEEEDGERVYFSHISVSSLLKRSALPF